MRGVYIHIPFCKSICSYCDFCKMYKNDLLIFSYLKKLEQEINDNYQNDLVKSIYIGGGTPTCIGLKNLRYLFKIIKKFNLDKTFEFTFECNGNDLNENLLKLLKKNKVNRLSIGVESFNNKLLKLMNRKKVDINKIKLAKQYFSNINVDLIYGFNNQSIKDLNDDLEKIISLDVSHISAYSLILENNTMLKINNYEEIRSDLDRKMYEIIKKRLTKEGYIHYEISNYSKKNKESKHNLIYWNNEEYYGFGLGSSGFINNVRYENTRSINNYLNNKIRLSSYEVSDKENMENELILGLRKIKGVSKKTFYDKYHKEIKDVFKVQNLKENKTNFYIPSNKLYISNSILVDFIDI